MKTNKTSASIAFVSALWSMGALADGELNLIRLNRATPAHDTVASSNFRGPSPSFQGILDLVSVQVVGADCDVAAQDAEVLDAYSLVLHNRKLMAAAGTDHTRRENRQICQYLLEFDKIEGYQFRLKSTTLDLVASLRSSADGLVKISGFHQGGDDAAAEKALTSSRSYRDLKLDFSTEEWSSCDSQAILAVKTEVRADVSSSASSHAHVTLDGPLGLELEWRACR